MKHIYFILLAITCTLVLGACTSKKEQPVEVSSAVFYNHDSLSYYAERAYMDDDPRGLFITGAAAYLKWQGDLPDSLGLTTVSRDEADIMLLRAAELGSQDAKNLILCLHKNNCWHHSLPTLNR